MKETSLNSTLFDTEFSDLFQQIEDSYSTLSAQTVVLKTNCTDFEKQVELSKREYTEASKTAAKYREAFTDVNKQLKFVIGVNEKLLSEKEHLEKELEDFKADTSSLKLQNETLRTRLSNATLDVTRLEQDLKDAEMERGVLQQELQQQIAEKDELQRDRVEYETALSEAYQKHSELKRKYEDALLEAASFSTAQYQRDKIQNRLGEAISKIRRYEARIRNCRPCSSYFSANDLETEDPANSGSGNPTSSKPSRNLVQTPASSPIWPTGAKTLQVLPEDNHRFGNSKEQNLESITITANSEYVINGEESSNSKKKNSTEWEVQLSDENVIPRSTSTNNIPRLEETKMSVPYSNNGISEGHENISKSTKRFASGIPRLTVGATTSIPRISGLKRPTLAPSKKTNLDKKGSIALTESGLRDAMYDFHPQPKT